MGHLDTIFEGQGHRFERAGRTARGAGGADMKGGDVALLFALKALHGAGMLENAAVRVFLTGDEENPGLPTAVSRRDLVEAARQSDVGLSFESDSGKVAIGRRGLSTWTLEASGMQGHSASVLRPAAGAGAIYEASRILDGFREAFTGHPAITINPGIFLGGTDTAYDAEKSAGTAAGKFNIIARTGIVKGDLRFVTDSERDEAKSRMQEIAAAGLPRTTARLAFEDLAPGGPASEGNRAVLALIDRVSRDLGQGPVEADDPVSRGFGDFNFIGALVSGADGLGVKGNGEHGPAESMDLDSLGPCTARAAIVISRLLRQTS
jgi:glutamate carboxypeptidase